MTDRKLHIEHGENTPLHPWYKERLRTKFLKDPVKKTQLYGTLHGGRYDFLNAGLDGFRDRHLASCAGTFIQPRRGTAPVIFGLSNRACPGRLPKHFTEEQVVHSKQNRRSQEQRRYVEEVERKLKAHPLALYPYLESGMTPELFDDVLSVLDPEMHVKREPTVTRSEKPEERAEDNVAPRESLTHEPSTEEPTKPPITTATRKEEVKGISSKNPYKLKDVKETDAKEKQLAGVKDLSSPSQDEDLKKVIKLFWGETNNLTESTLMSLFVRDYEKKPGLTFPIHVLEPSQIPKKLHTTGECLHKDHSHSVHVKDSNKAHAFWFGPYSFLGSPLLAGVFGYVVLLRICRFLSKHRVCSPSVKTTYGAWYLHPKTWKKRPANEPLRDPSATKDPEKDEELKHIYATRAFKQFIISKRLRMPKFLSSLFLEDGGTRGTNRTSSALTRKGTVTL